jgi:hypothetical protein
VSALAEASAVAIRDRSERHRTTVMRFRSKARRASAEETDGITQRVVVDVSAHRTRPSGVSAIRVR